MISELNPDLYLDEVYTRGLHIVLLHRGDDLFREAVSQLRAVVPRLYSSDHVKMWTCQIETAEHAELIQVVKLPQVRFFRNGSEMHSHVGVMNSDAILEQIYQTEKKR